MGMGLWTATRAQSRKIKTKRDVASSSTQAQQTARAVHVHTSGIYAHIHTHTQLSCTQRTHSAFAAPKIKQRQKVCNTQFLILNGCRGSPMGEVRRGLGGLVNAVDSAAVAYSQLTGLKCTSAPHKPSTR